MVISVKRMVCPRCIATVTLCAEEAGLAPTSVALGEVTFPTLPTATHLAEFKQCLASHGFEIVESEKARLISRIKALIIERVHYDKGAANLKLSAYLSQNLHYDYSHLSKLFSTVEAMTIERYATLQRVERAKELLSYDEKSVTEIAEELDYSSPAHFSAQFKQQTGMTPSQFKKLQRPDRRSLDSL